MANPGIGQGAESGGWGTKGQPWGNQNPTLPPWVVQRPPFRGGKGGYGSSQGLQSAFKGKVNPPQWGAIKYERAEKQVWDVMESMNDNDKIKGDDIMKMFSGLIDRYDIEYKGEDIDLNQNHWGHDDEDRELMKQRCLHMYNLGPGYFSKLCCRVAGIVDKKSRD
eukprot:11493701-Karenia_brevis.AAC.1